MAALPPHAQVEGRWQLGRNYSAIVFDEPQRREQPFPLWTFEITHDRRVVLRHRELNWRMRVTRRDVTGDGVADVLVHAINDGTGGCGTWRVYGGAPVRELWVQSGCIDWKRVDLRAGSVQTWVAIPSSQTKATLGGIHCCWRLWRHVVWRWIGGALVRAPATTSARPPAPSY